MLKPRKRITKKTLKEDKLVTFYFKAQTWVDQNSKTLLIALAAFIAVLAIVIFLNFTHKKKEAGASVELAKAMRAYQESDYQNALPLLNNLVENYGSTHSGKLGAFYLANTFFKNGDFDNAQKYYKKFASGFKGDEVILSSAMAGIAACLEQKNDYEGAARQYEKTAARFSDTFIAPAYFIKAGRCYSLAQNNEKAKQLYEKIIKDYPESKEKDDAILLKALF
ncbi:MAG TPA: tetratricopeptide repeat protein [bacterium]|nr:tetratricopeptide repeat protein [bacterium]HPN45345.1 tetratricopeptide repeat protein [bacterium]